MIEFVIGAICGGFIITCFWIIISVVKSDWMW